MAKEASNALLDSIDCSTCLRLQGTWLSNSQQEMEDAHNEKLSHDGHKWLFDEIFSKFGFNIFFTNSFTTKIKNLDRIEAFCFLEQVTGIEPA